MKDIILSINPQQERQIIFVMLTCGGYGVGGKDCTFFRHGRVEEVCWMQLNIWMFLCPIIGQNPSWFLKM